MPTHSDQAPDVGRATPRETAHSSDPLRLRVHVVSHTHWDREWYHSAGRFRQRLIPLIDALLDTPNGGSSFLLDGQAILLADYLAVRADRQAALSAQLTAGAIEAGPWYVLADNLIPSGEAIIRNLEAGRRLLARFGASAPKVAYCPDTFGHPAMMPAIATGFGLPAAVVWRGLGGQTHPHVDAMKWRAPDGSTVIAYHLPPDGYEFGSALPTDATGAKARWRALATLWRERNRTGTVLLPNGADHHARQHGRDDALRLLARAAAADGAILIDSSLGRFAESLTGNVDANMLAVVDGELRDSYGYTWTLQGTFGTRAHQKRTNARLERTLLRDVEPWLALAWLHGDVASCAVSRDARLTLAQLPSLLDHAWETLLRTHPHDTLCGCSTDEVALAMEARQRSVATQAEGLRVGALQLALGHDPAVARDIAPRAQPSVVVRNRAQYARGGIAEIRLLETLGDVRVGPGSGDAAPLHAPLECSVPTVLGAIVQAGATRLAHARRESPQHYPDDDLVRSHRVVAWMPPVPAHGARVFETGSPSTHDAHVQNVHLTRAKAQADHAQAPAARGDTTGRGDPADVDWNAPRNPVSLVHVGDSVSIDNGLVCVTCDSAGVHVRVGDRLVPNALSIHSQRDAGDSYTPSLRGSPRDLTLVGTRAGARGPLRASIILRWKLTTEPAPAIDDVVPSDVESMRSDGAPSPHASGAVIVETELILDADAVHLRCDMHGVNTLRNHRLQLRWNTDVAGDTVHADAAFGPVPRTPIVAPDHARATEAVPPTMPLHRWVALSDGARGATLISDGLAEAEVSNGKLSVTLLRAIGELSRADLPERPGHAGWPCATPQSQSPGRFRARVGLLLHGAWSAPTLERIERSCDQMLLPLTGETWRDYAGAATTISGPTLIGEGLRASAVTLAADGQSLLLRVSNITDADASGWWMLPAAGPWHVTRCRLDETPLGDAQLCDAKIPLHLAPRALHTLLISRP